MTSRSDRLRAFLDENGPFEGSVADLAGEIDDPSPNALSACVSVAIKEGWLRRHPETGGVKAEWLWLATQRIPEALVVSEPAPIEPVVEPEPERRQDPLVDIAGVQAALDRAEVEPDPDPPVHSAPARGSRLRAVEPEPCVEGPSPMRITIDVAPWQIRVDGTALTVREAKALIRDLQAALSVVDA